jgi:hypothetical protein
MSLFRTRVSMPNWLRSSPIAPLAPDLSAAGRWRVRRWSGTDLASIRGSYDDYLLSKVSKVFSQLK